MNIPSKSDNIYPKTRKNIKYLINFYFDDLEPNREDLLEFLISKTSLTLNQLEFILKITAENYYFFKKNFNHKKLSVFLTYSIDVLTKPADLWEGSEKKIQLLVKLRDLFEGKIEDTDNITPFIIDDEPKIDGQEEEYDYVERGSNPNYEANQSYDDWIDQEFGDEAETARGNLD